MKNIILEKFLIEKGIDLRILDLVEKAYNTDVHSHKSILADKGFNEGMYPFIYPEIILPIWQDKEQTTITFKNIRVNDFGRNEKLESFIQMFDDNTKKELMKQYCILGWTTKLVERAEKENFDLNSVIFDKN